MIAKIKEPKPVVHLSIQLITAEHKEPEPRVNIVTRSGASTGLISRDAKKNIGPEWVHKTTTKLTPLDLQKKKETF